MLLRGIIYYAPLEILFCMVSFLAEIKISIFWLKTMDHGGLTEIEVIFVLLVLRSGRSKKLNMHHSAALEILFCILLLLRCPF